MEIKDFDFAFKKEFPVNVKTTLGIDEGFNVLHRHSSIEICYIKEGTGKQIIGQKQYDFAPGDIFVVDSNEVHLAYEDVDAIIDVFFFEPEFLWLGSSYSFSFYKAFWAAGKHYDCKIDKSNSDVYDPFLSLIKNIKREFLGNKNGYQMMIKLYLLEISVLLQRELISIDSEQHKKKMKDCTHLKPVFEYIDQNYHNKVTLGELASLAHMSVTSFCTSFRYFTGISPLEYIIRDRILNAARMLRETDMKVIHIALECGFRSIPHFIECFKKSTGQPPNCYRNSGQSNGNRVSEKG